MEQISVANVIRKEIKGKFPKLETEVGTGDLWRCNRCGGYFHYKNRLPENHNCSGLPKRSWDTYRQMQKRWI